MGHSENLGCHVFFSSSKIFVLGVCLGFFQWRHNLALFFNFDDFFLPQIKQIIDLKHFSWQLKCFFSIRSFKKIENHSVSTVFKIRKDVQFRIFFGVVLPSRLYKWEFGILVWSTKVTKHCPIYFKSIFLNFFFLFP